MFNQDRTGEKLEKFLLDITDQSPFFKGIKVTFLELNNEKKKLRTLALNIAKSTKQNLINRFPYIKVINKFGIFDLDIIKQQQENKLIEYGNQTISELIDYFAFILPKKELILSD